MMRTAQNQNGGDLTAPVTYTVEGREFVVEPVYNEQAHESMGEILLKIIMNNGGEKVGKD
ncbi:MAG: hypothetical protein LBS36_13205 [Oscillospiraceae bacterium]|jgi:hypothetical protein|nr:hypothetical protein [Oscillospiraceae bacterium]